MSIIYEDEEQWLTIGHETFPFSPAKIYSIDKIDIQKFSPNGYWQNRHTEILIV